MDQKKFKNPSSRIKIIQKIYNSLRDGMPRETISVWDMTQMGYYSRAAFKTYNTSTYFDSGYSGNLGWAFPTNNYSWIYILFNWFRTA